MVAKTVLVSTRKSEERANKLKKHIEQFGMLIVSIVKNDDIYEIRARPSMMGKVYIGDINSKGFASYLRIVQYGPDGEVI